MRVSLGLPTDRVDAPDEFVTGAAVAEMAAAAEAAGFDAVFVTDHPFPDDEWLASGGHHALDPFVALSFAAAATTRLRLHTNLLVVAYRNPFVTAKAVASLDVLSGGRLMLGIGAGYLEPEFEALGVPFAERNDLTDEAIVAMKRAWTEDGVAMEGRHWRAAGHTALPKPAQQPHPPIWIGGNSRRAIRRAVELADGWMPMVNPAKYAERRRSAVLESLDDLAAGVDYARAHAREVGRDAPVGVMFSLGGLRNVPATADDPTERAVEVARELAAVGVTDLYTIVRRPASRAEYLAEVDRMGRDLLPTLATISPR